MILKAYAKINLTLDVLHKRPDGYHALKSIMHRISLCDTVHMDAAPRITVEADIPLPFENTAYRAAKLYQERFQSPGASIRIEKRIPSEAGLGGGSADAAAVLLGMERLYQGAKGDMRPLFEIAEKVGADVPFCLAGGCALCEGIGEILTPLPGIPMELLLVKPKEGVSTPGLFKSLSLPVSHPRTEEALEAIRRGDVPSLGALLFNALEAPAAALVPRIGEYKERLLSLGALGAVMSGSGSSVFAVFANGERADRAMEAFGEAFFLERCITI